MMILLVILLMISADNRMHAETIRTTHVCPSSFKAVAEKCYYFSTEEVAWTDSHFHCQLLNGSLTVINSYRENKQLRDFLSTVDGSVLATDEYWIDGIYDWKQRTWKWGSSGQNIRFNVFSRKHLGNDYKWKCITLNAAKYNKWLARKCTEKKRFVCETKSNILVRFNHLNENKKKFNISKCSSRKKLNAYEEQKCFKLLGNTTENEPAAYVYRDEPRRAVKKMKKKNANRVCPSYMVLLGNKCYFFGNVETSWTEAHFECRKNGSKLAMIRNRSQDNKLRRFLNNFIERHDRWIGGIFDWKTQTWRWAMTGQPVAYDGFHPNFTKEKLLQEFSWNSIFMDPKWDNQWNADKQSAKKSFICQRKAQTVRNLGHLEHE